MVPRTGTNIFTDEDQEDTQSKEPLYQEEELREQPSTSGRISREAQQILRDAEKFIGTPRNGKRQRRPHDRYQGLVDQVEEPSSFQEVVQHQVWVDAMIEEYASIMTNDVWEVVPRP